MASLETLCCVWAVCHEVAPQKLERGTAVPVQVADHVEAVRPWATVEEPNWIPTSGRWVQLTSLERAAGVGSVEGLQFCWGRTKVAARQHDAQRALVNAAVLIHLPAVRWLVKEARANVHVCHDEAVRRSAAGGHLSVVQWLVEEGGADVHADGDGDHALWASVYYGHLPVVRWLVKEGGADVHAGGDYALQSSASCGHLSVVRWLVEEGGADVHAIDGFSLLRNTGCGGYPSMPQGGTGEGRLAVVQWLVEESEAEWTEEAMQQILGTVWIVPPVDSVRSAAVAIVRKACERASESKSKRQRV